VAKPLQMETWLLLTASTLSDSTIADPLRLTV